MAYDDENEELDGLPHCTECGAEEFLNPETGLCLDCQLELEEDEGDDDGDEEICIECGDTSRGSSSDAGNEIGDDGLCPECREALGLDDEDSL